MKLLALEVLSAGGAPVTTLPFTMQPQKQTNWCWSAVATSTSHYYESQSRWEQCGVVNEELGVATCCDNGGDDSCNQPWYLDRALQRVGRFGAMSAEKAAWATLSQEVDARRPLCLRIGWNGGGGHFVVVSGYDTAAEMIDVKDPFFGDSSVTYATFPDAYHTGGLWTHSYMTQ